MDNLNVTESNTSDIYKKWYEDCLKEYEKLKRDYELLIETNERLKPNSKNHMMILDIHPYCNKCLRFKPVVKKYIDISEETIVYETYDHTGPMYDSKQYIKGNTVVSCEHHDTCSIMYDYIYKYLRKK